MRKVSSYIRLPVISAEQNSILGTITGVLCDKRLKNVHYFIFEDVSSPLSERRYVAQRSLKIIADESVILSNVLCIKNDGRRLLSLPSFFNPQAFRCYETVG